MTQLKKEFQKKDVERIRNLVQGKYGEKTRESVGYTPPDEQYKEGDIWESRDGRTWTIRDGIKQNITKLDSAKKSLQTPLFCPKCNKIMNNGLDSSYYKGVGQCFSCFKKFETNLKITGLWDEWVKKTTNGNIDTFITWYKDWVMDSLDVSNKSYLSEQGDVETWRGGVNKAKALEALNKTIELWEEAKE